MDGRKSPSRSKRQAFHERGEYRRPRDETSIPGGGAGESWFQFAFPFARIIFSVIPYIPLHVKYIFRWLKMIHKTKLKIKLRAADGKDKSGDMRKTRRFHRGIKSVL